MTRATKTVQSLPTPPNDGGIGTWVGFTGLGFGVVILYAAVKDVPIFGPNGIVTNAVTKGELTHVVNGKAVAAAPGSTTGKLATGFEKAAAKPLGSTANQAIGTAGKSLGNQIASALGIGGLANEIERLPVIGRIINDGGNFWQAGTEIGQNAGRAAGQGIGHAIADGAKSVGHAAKSYLSALKGFL